MNSFFNRTEKLITKLTIDKLFEKMIELQKENILITDSKKIGCFGDSYLYSVLFVTKTRVYKNFIIYFVVFSTVW